jgi:cytochrome b561
MMALVKNGNRGQDMNKDGADKFATATVVLHWLVGISIIGLLAVGIYMEETKAYALYPLHKSFGVLIFFVAVARILWRIGNGWPVPAGDHQRWEHLLARAIHWLLIIGTVLMPISGFLMSSLGGHGVAVFGFELVPPNPDPANPDKVVAHNEMLAGLSHQVHGAAGVTMIVALLLHVAGALKHHVIDKDGTLRRMLGARISG